MQLKWLKRVATVKDDGTVEFDVPGDVKPQSLKFGTGDAYGQTVDGVHDAADKTDTLVHDADTADVVQDLPPLQIVMLIVGTRGDVQPFIAIGKRLQVVLHFFFSMCFLVEGMFHDHEFFFC